MVMKDDHVNLAEAKARLSTLVDRVERGERIAIYRRGRPAALLVPAVQSYASVAERLKALQALLKEPVLEPGETWRALAHKGHAR